MVTSIPETAELKPELIYAATTDRAERRRLEEAVLIAYRPQVARFVRRRVHEKHWQEAEQVGLIGLLVALQKYDPIPRPGFEEPTPFWFFAMAWVRKELQRWVSLGVYWRPSTNGAKGRRVHTEHLQHWEFVEDQHGVDPDIEGMVATAEGLDLVAQFLETVTAEERHLLLCEKRDRGNPDSERVRRYLSLVERCRAFVEGDDDDRNRSSVSRCKRSPRTDS